MFLNVLKSVVNALTGKKSDETSHPLDGPVRAAAEKVNKVKKSVEPDRGVSDFQPTWPFPIDKPVGQTEAKKDKPISKPKAKPAASQQVKKTPKQIAAEKRKAAAAKDKARAKKVK